MSVLQSGLQVPEYWFFNSHRVSEEVSRAVVHHFKGEYLHDPSADDLQGISAKYVVLEFFCCVGFLDFT